MKLTLEYPFAHRTITCDGSALLTLQGNVDVSLLLKSWNLSYGILRTPGANKHLILKLPATRQTWRKCACQADCASPLTYALIGFLRSCRKASVQSLRDRRRCRSSEPASRLGGDWHLKRLCQRARWRYLRVMSASATSWWIADAPLIEFYAIGQKVSRTPWAPLGPPSPKLKRRSG
jgi:hypothetical protein